MFWLSSCGWHNPKFNVLIGKMLPRFQISFIISDKDNGFTVRRDMRKPGIAGFVKRHLGLFGAVFLHSPYLHQTRAYGIEPDIFSARGIFGTIVQSFCCRQLSFFSSFNWNNVNVIIAFPVGTIGKLPSIRAPSV